MRKDLEDLYGEYLAHSSANELEIVSSHTCVCYECGSTFSARRVSAWYHDNGELSAACPECGLRSVVGDFNEFDTDKATLAVIYRYHLEHETAAERRRNLEEFCAHFYDGKFEDTAHFEELYQTYLLELFHTYQQPMACLALARLYSHGLQHTSADLDQAIEYYSDPVLSADATAIFERGLCHDSRGLRGDARAAFECFSKSSALGSLSAAIAIANYYLQGKYVKQDSTFALNLLFSVFGEMYAKALTGLNNIAEFATTANTIALCLHDGMGCKANHYRALRYYLLATYFGDLVSERYGVDLSWVKEANETIDRLVVEEFPPMSDTILFDEDTFFDSFYEQYDDLAQKEIVSAENDGDVLVLKLRFNRPVLVVDTANAIIEEHTETEWRLQGSKVTYQSGATAFERIEFDGEASVSFYHDDPVLGETLVATIAFPPPPPPEDVN